MYFLFTSALLLCAAALLLIAAGWRDVAQRRRMARRMGVIGTLGSGRNRIDSLTAGSVRWNLDSEVPRLLDQLGWRRSGQRAAFYSLQTGLPLLGLLLLGLYYGLYAGDRVHWFWVLLLMAGVLLLPKRVLVAAVQRRRLRLANEVSTMLPLLHMFFEVGMTVEQALRVLVAEAEPIVPELTRDLRMVLARVDGGLELGGELQAMAQLTEVDELQDCIGILDQLIRQGGGALSSLRSFKALLDERRMLALQETVSKLSAKMSGVMVAFLFPSLLIVLAGPGFVAVLNALGNMTQ